MFTQPGLFQEFLSHHGLIDDIYNAMQNPDLSEVVLVSLEILRKTNNIPRLEKRVKNESKSNSLRNEGNKAYGAGRYQLALACYNRALLFAPKNSHAMKLAYSNRSALYHKMKAFSACLTDIDTCFKLGCPIEIVDKLHRRKKEAGEWLWMEALAEEAKRTPFSEEFFKLKHNNSKIPCVSADVDVIFENGFPKVIATTDIKIGTVVAVEPSFVSQVHDQNVLNSCYYCQKISLNLKPCDRCVSALFCSEECREKCMIEYHNIECQFVEVYKVISGGALCTLATKAVLKIRQMCNSWQELILASHEMGAKRLQNSDSNEIYDNNHKFSLLASKDERHFLEGPLYNASFACASILHYLEDVPHFLPEDLAERDSAKRALGRLLMFLCLYSTHTHVVLSVLMYYHEKTEFHDTANFSWFSFIGKLPNSCTPNLLAIGLNKNMALMAIQPLKSGTELTLSHVGHWLDNDTSREIRCRNMFMLFGVVCNCLICTEKYKHYKYKLSEFQKKSVRKLKLSQMNETVGPRNVPEVFLKLCKTLAFLSDVPYSTEYILVYRLIRRCTLYFQDYNTSNVTLDYF